MRWRAFPLRPTRDPGTKFKGTYREAGWTRCRDLARDVDVEYRMWVPVGPRLELARARRSEVRRAARRGALRDRAPALYRAFFTDGANIGRSEEVIEVVGAVPGVDAGRFLADYEAGLG